MEKGIGNKPVRCFTILLKFWQDEAKKWEGKGLETRGEMGKGVRNDQTFGRECSQQLYVKERQTGNPNAHLCGSG